MLNVIFAELADEIIRDIIRKRQEESKPCNPFMKPVEDEIKRLENLEKQAKERRQMLESLHQWMSQFFESMESGKKEPEPKTEPESPPEETVPEKPGPEPFTAEDPPESEEDQLHMGDPEPEQTPNQEPNLTEAERLEMLEGELNYVVNVLFNTKMAHRFTALRELLAELASLANTEDMPNHQREKTIEAELRKAVDVLGESSCAARSKVTIDLREHLVDLLDRINA